MIDNIGFGEILIIALIILILFGPKRIPDIARGIARGIREFKRAMYDVKSELEDVTGIEIEDKPINAVETPSEPHPDDQNPPEKLKTNKKKRTARKTTGRKTKTTRNKTKRSKSK